jgi:hypothetical protein
VNEEIEMGWFSGSAGGYVPSERQLRRYVEMRAIVGSWFDHQCANCHAKHCDMQCTKCGKDFCRRCSSLHQFVC